MIDMKEKKAESKTVQDMLDKPFFSDRKNVARVIGLALAIIIAVTAITIGVVQIGKKDPGLYELEAEPIGSLPFYASGIHLNYYFDGTSDEIKAQIASVKAVYSDALKQSYQWFDAETTYAETANLARINQNFGKAIKLQEDLFDVLQDALERTTRGEGYSVFASPLLHMSESLLYSNDPVSLDPVNENDHKEFIAKLKQVIFENPGTLILDQNSLTATLTLSEDYLALIEEYELDAYGVLNLGVLSEAYRISYLAKVLEANGFTNGYLTTDSGITFLLGSYGNDAAYCLYSLEENGQVTLSATKSAACGNSSCSFHAFALSGTDLGFYTLEQMGNRLYRSPYQITFEDKQAVLSALVVAKENKIVDAAYTCACILATTDSATALSLAKDSGLSYILDLNDGEATLYLSDTNGVETVTSYKTVLP